jgi:hypothetical protein
MSKRRTPDGPQPPPDALRARTEAKSLRLSHRTPYKEKKLAKKNPHRFLFGSKNSRLPGKGSPEKLSIDNFFNYITGETGVRPCFKLEFNTYLNQGFAGIENRTRYPPTAPCTAGGKWYYHCTILSALVLLIYFKFKCFIYTKRKTLWLKPWWA